MNSNQFELINCNDWLQQTRLDLNLLSIIFSPNDFLFYLTVDNNIKYIWIPHVVSFFSFLKTHSYLTLWVEKLHRINKFKIYRRNIYWTQISLDTL